MKVPPSTLSWHSVFNTAPTSLHYFPFSSPQRIPLSNKYSQVVTYNPELVSQQYI